MAYHRLLCVWLLALGLFAALPARGTDQPAPFKQENKADNLKALCELFHQTVHVKKDVKQAATLFRALIPDEARAKKALKDNVAADVLQKVSAQLKKITLSDEEAGKLTRPEQSAVKVYAATTEELAKYEKGSVAFNEFPGGAQRLAEKALRANLTFYEVEFTEPGKGAGIKFHLFYWDGAQWAMLGPMWRVVD